MRNFYKNMVLGGFFGRTGGSGGSGGGGGDAGGSGGGLATGTLTLAERQSNLANPDIRVTHNLGYSPSCMLWFIESSPSVNSSGRLEDENKIAFEYVSLSTYIFARCNNSFARDDNIQYCIKSTPQSLHNGLLANENDIRILFADSNRYPGYIPEGSTIRWIVW